MKKWLSIIILVVVLVVVLASYTAIFSLVNYSKCDKNNESEHAQNTTAEDATKYAVTFYSNDGTVLKIEHVKEYTSATPPVTPKMTNGMVFKSWDTDFSNITHDLDIHPVCDEIKDNPNVIVVQSAYSAKDKVVMVPIQLCGDVCVAGLDITIMYDQEQLKLQSITEDKSVVFNTEIPGKIKLNYVSVSNTVADVDICNLMFIVTAIEGEILITININGIYAFKDESDELYIPESTVIDGKVFVVG